MCSVRIAPESRAYATNLCPVLALAGARSSATRQCLSCRIKNTEMQASPARIAAITLAGLAPSNARLPVDLRRTCARLCHSAGGELEQIQFLLGHVSIQTTERYLGCKQRVRAAVNDRIGIEPEG
jgi:integrase